ncbi:putative ribonuclease H-like domain-containing protein [Tanacetum coccineum]
MVKEGIVLGHKVSSAGLEVDKAKINIIPLTNIKGVISFLGHTGFYQRFIKDFSKIARPLTKLLKKDTPFEFDDECHNAFKLLKEKLTCAPVIVSPNWNLPFELMCDASNFAVGAILGQKDALRHLFKKQDAKPRLIRWILLLQEFDIEIKNRKGTENVAAGHLSRIENDETSDDSEVDDNFPGETLMKLNTRDEPWFADFANNLEPYLFKVCSDGTLALRYGKLRSMLKIALLQLCISLCPGKYRSPLIFPILSLLSVITLRAMSKDPLLSIGFKDFVDDLTFGTENPTHKLVNKADGAKSSRVPVPLLEDPYEAIRQAYLDGTDTESEPFEDPIDTETPESPLAIAPPIPLSESTSPILVHILCRTTRMAVRVLHAMSSGLSTGMAKVADMSESAFLEESEEEDDEEDEEIKESMDSNSVSEDVEEEGPTIEDEDPATEDEGLTAGVESPGMDDEGYGLDDESRGIDDEGHRVESDRLGLEEEEEKAVPGGQQQAAPVVETAVSVPLGLGYGALRRHKLALEEGDVYSHDAAYAMTWGTLKKKLTEKYCPKGEIKKLEIELWNLKIRRNNVAAYTQRFQELALICTKFLVDETEKVDKYISGLLENIHGNVMSARPKTLDDAIELANDLMDQKLRTYAERPNDNKRKADDSSRNNQQPHKKQNIARAYIAGPGNEAYTAKITLCHLVQLTHVGNLCIPGIVPLVILEAIKSRFGGNDESNKMHKYILKQQFEGFSAYSTEDVNQEILRVFESDVKDSTASSSSTNGLEMAGGHDFYENEKVLQKDRSKGNQDSRRRDAWNTRNKDKENGRRSGKQEDSKALVTLDREGSDTEVTSCLKECKESNAKLKKLYDEQREQLGDASIEIQAYTQALKKVEAQLKSARDKAGLRYGDQMNKGVLSYENEVFQSVFVSRTSDIEDNPMNDRYAGGMHVVPPPMTGIYIPSGPDKEIDDSQFTYDSEDEHVSQSTEEQETPNFANQQRMAKQVELNKKMGKGNVQRENRPIWNNVQRVNYKNQFVPTAVLTRTGKILVSTARASGTNNVSTTRQNFNSQAVLTNAARKISTVKPVVNRVNTAEDYPHRTLQNKGVVDSGCSRHMTGNKAYLAEYQDFNGGPVAFGGSKGYITGKGKIKIGKLDFEDVCFVKELQHFNLFFVSQICDKKNKVLFTDSECLVLSPEFKLPDANQVLLRIPRQNNMYSFNLENLVPSRGLACLIAKATIDESNKWHRRLGHVNFKNLNKLVKGNLVRGLPSKIFQNDHTCVACQKGKQHKASCKAKSVSSISQPLQLLHMDLFGPTSVRSLNHKTYCLVITDDFSRFSWVFFLRTKDETSGILKDFIRQIKNQLNQKVKTIRCDNGTEFKNRDFIEFCGSKGIKREYSNARTPQQNRVAERKNRTLIEAARTMLADSFLPNTFWAEAVSTTCYVLNRFDGKSDEGFLVGYSLQSKAFRVYNLETKRVEENLHITFLENKPNVAGKGPTWLFDLDYLTDSMNYQPVRSENQANKHAGPQEANQNAGTEDIIDAGDSEKEAESAQDYFVLPIWSSYTSTVKSSKANNAGEEPTKHPDFQQVDKEDQVFLDELERLKRQEQDANDAAEALRKEFAQETEDLLLQAGAAKASSTNIVNTASTPVSTASPYGGLSFTDLTNTDQDDSEIPALEEIYDNPTDGIFTNSSYDDEGAVADFTNLEPVVNVSPIPTSRINSIHPSTLILGDPQSAVQTRSKVTKSSGAHAFSVLVLEDEDAERTSESQPTTFPSHPSEVHVEPLLNPTMDLYLLLIFLISQSRGILLGNHRDQAKQIKQLKAQIKKLKKKVKHVIAHYKAWGRKSAKAEPSVHKDPLFDELANDTLDYMDTENAQDVGRTRNVVYKEKESAEDAVGTEDVVSTDKKKVSTDRSKVSTDRSRVSTDKEEVSTDRPDEGTDDQTKGRYDPQTPPTTTTPSIFAQSRFDESFTAVGSTKDERKIKGMNEGAKDLEQKRLMKKVAKETP